MSGPAVVLACELDHLAVSMSIRWQELPEYDPPRLLDTRMPAALWQATVFVSAIGALLLTLATRHDSTSVVGWARWSALLGGFGSCAAGAWWSLMRTRNIHRLEARVPTEARSLRAWAWPVIWVALMSVTLVRADPTELVDVRPGIIALGFVFASWRPFSLIQRLFKSLSLLRFDELIVSLGAIQIATWLLVWWQLAVIDPTPEGSSPSAEAFEGVAAACTLAFSGLRPRTRRRAGLRCPTPSPPRLGSARRTRPTWRGRNQRLRFAERSMRCDPGRAPSSRRYVSC